MYSKSLRRQLFVRTLFASGLIGLAVGAVINQANLQSANEALVSVVLVAVLSLASWRFVLWR